MSARRKLIIFALLAPTLRDHFAHVAPFAQRGDRLGLHARRVKVLLCRRGMSGKRLHRGCLLMFAARDAAEELVPQLQTRRRHANASFISKLGAIFAAQGLHAFQTDCRGRLPLPRGAKAPQRRVAPLPEQITDAF